MAQSKTLSLDLVQFENVSFHIEGLDPVLTSVDLDIPMDKTVIVQASQPTHAVHLLEILAGVRQPQKGKVKWINDKQVEDEINSNALYDMVSAYFESQRAHPESSVIKIFEGVCASSEKVQMAIEHFELKKLINKKFKELSYEYQKLVMLVVSTLRSPQMLVLEDPALGLSETSFLNYLDWIQYWQRQGQIRHLYMTNNHPTAARHFDHITMFVDEGLIYVEDEPLYKKVVHF